MNMHAPISSFVPAAGNAKELRSAFSRFATGVTIVTAMTDRGPVGMTANSFSSVSLHPPLTLWSIDRKSSRYDAFAGTWDTAIHVLSKIRKRCVWPLPNRPTRFRSGHLA
jgi:flavin reductase (DIM6/NTAB) family NADH-FMN oxidoreductase RutF